MSNSNSFNVFGARLRAFILASDEGHDDFNSLALALFRLQYDSIPIYREYCDHRRATPDTLTQWSDIPSLPAIAFKEWELTSLPEIERTRVFFSSGTTGHVPSRHFHSAESIALYEASLVPWFEKHFLPNHDGKNLGCVILSPNPEQTPHSSLVHMFETIRYLFQHADYFASAEKDGSWTLNGKRVVDVLEKCVSEKRPVALLGTAFSFVHLIDYLKGEKRTFSLPAGSRVFETGGYKGRSRALSKADLHKFISKTLGIPASHILSEYGMSELSSQAYDCVVGAPVSDRVFHFPPWARARILSAETGDPVKDGEVGLVQVMDLANVRSIMSVQTEDLAVRQGDGFELQGRAPYSEPRGCSLMAGVFNPVKQKHPMQS